MKVKGHFDGVPTPIYGLAMVYLGSAYRKCQRSEGLGLKLQAAFTRGSYSSSNPFNPN